jgi:hypothetical protein
MRASEWLAAAAVWGVRAEDHPGDSLSTRTTARARDVPPSSRYRPRVLLSTLFSEMGTHAPISLRERPVGDPSQHRGADRAGVPEVDPKLMMPRFVGSFPSPPPNELGVVNHPGEHRSEPIACERIWVMMSQQPRGPHAGGSSPRTPGPQIGESRHERHQR